MQIQVPYTFTANVIPWRARNPRPVNFSGSRPLSITIQEMQAVEAPLAFRFYVERNDYSVRPPVKHQEPIDIRVFNGKFYRPELRHNGERKVPLTVDCAIKDLRHDTRMPVVYDGVAFPILLRSGYREVDMGEDRQIEEIRNYFAKILVVDGVLYKPTTEPRYLIQRSFWNNEHTTWLSVVPTYERHGNTDLSYFFNANKKKEAMTLLNNLVQNGCKNNPADNHNIEVFLPGVVLLDPREDERKEQSALVQKQLQDIDDRIAKITTELEDLHTKRAIIAGNI